MKTLVFGDLHHELQFAREVIKNERPSRIIFLGDFVDFRPSQAKKPADFKEVLEFIVEMSQVAENVILGGNHEMQYIEQHYNEYGWKMACGAGRTNMDIFNNFFKDKHLDRIFKAAHIEEICGQKVLMTHAGLHKEHAEKEGLSSIEECRDRIEKRFEDAFQCDFKEIPKIISAVGMCRGGHDFTGGVFWRDSNDEPTDLPAHQMFGHTATPNTLVIRTVNGFKQVNLDGRQSIYLVIESEKPIIRARNENGERMKFNVDLDGEYLKDVSEYEIQL